MRISDVTKSKARLQETIQKLSELGVHHSRYVPKGSLIMSICATVGRPILTDIDVCIHDGFVVFERPRISQEFLYHVKAALYGILQNVSEVERIFFIIAQNKEY